MPNDNSAVRSALQSLSRKVYPARIAMAENAAVVVAERHRAKVFIDSSPATAAWIPVRVSGGTGSVTLSGRLTSTGTASVLKVRTSARVADVTAATVTATVGNEGCIAGCIQVNGGRFEIYLSTSATVEMYAEW